MFMGLLAPRAPRPSTRAEKRVGDGPDDHGLEVGRGPRPGEALRGQGLSEEAAPGVPSGLQVPREVGQKRILGYGSQVSLIAGCHSSVGSGRLAWV